MSTQTIEHVDTTPASTDGDRPDVEHVYCGPCNATVRVAVSMCGGQQVDTLALGPAEWSADKQACIVCAEMLDEPCPRCGR